VFPAVEQDIILFEENIPRQKTFLFCRRTGAHARNDKLQGLGIPIDPESKMRRIGIQKKDPDTLMTQCPKCNAEEPFNIADLTIIGGALLKYAVAKGNCLELKAPNVTSEQVCQIIEDLEGLNDWPEEFKRQTLRSKLKILKGGLSTD